MSDDVVLLVDRLIQPASSSSEQTEPDQKAIRRYLLAGPSFSRPNEKSDGVVLGKERITNEEEEEGKPLIQAAECGICQEEDSLSNLETPYGCSGLL